MFRTRNPCLRLSAPDRRERQRCPKILADFDVEGEGDRSVRPEQEVSAERYRSTRQHQPALANAGAGSKMPSFVELAIVRQIGFRDNAEDAAAMDDDCGIEELSFVTYWP